MYPEPDGGSALLARTTLSTNTVCRVVLYEAVDGRICFTRKIQHGGDWERSRPQRPKNVHNFLMTVRPLSWACGHGTEMLLILKKNYFWPDSSPIFSDITVQRNVPRFCTRSRLQSFLTHFTSQLNHSYCERNNECLNINIWKGLVSN